MDKQYIVIVEISSSRISGIAASFNDETKIVSEICHYEEPVNGSVRYGSIINVNDVCSKVELIFDKIEKHKGLSPRKITKVFVGIDSRSLHSESVKIERDINEDFPITDALIKSVEESACKGFENLDILKVEPVLYEVDGKEVDKIVGAVGSHLAANYNIVVCKPQIRRSLSLVIERLSVELAGYVITPLAVSDLVLTDGERQLGAMLVDIGADITSVAIFKGGKLQYLNVLPMGSRNITRDLTSLNILEEDAERIKRTFGLSSESDIPNGEIMPGVNSIDALNYIKSRAGEIIANISNQLVLAGFQPAQLPSGVVIVGRGAKLKGLKDSLHESIGMDVRRGVIPDAKEEYNDRLSSLAILEAASTLLADGDSCMKLPEMPPVDESEVSIQETKEVKKSGEIKPQKPKGESFWDRLKKKINSGGDTILGDNEE